MTLGPLRFTNALGGTADFIYPGPTIDMQNPAAAGAVDGNAYLIYAQSFDMTQWEISTGNYTASSKTFARTTVTGNSLGTTAKINFSNPPQVFILEIGSGSGGTGRERLTGNRTYFVRTDGSDSNNGLTNTAGGAFLTIQKAINVCLTIDLNGFLVTVQVGAGSYSAGFVLTSQFVGGNVQIFGDTTTPANVVVSTGNSNNCFEVGNVGSQITVDGFKLSTGTSGVCCYARDGGLLQLSGAMEFGAASSGSHIVAGRAGIVYVNNNTAYTISGGASFHFNIASGGRIFANLNTVTLTGTPAFAIFANVNSGSILEVISTTYTGAATGTKNVIAGGAGVDTAGGVAPNALFPGSIAGTTTSPGWWT